jgi:hypothetical protein
MFADAREHNTLRWHIYTLQNINERQGIQHIDLPPGTHHGKRLSCEQDLDETPCKQNLDDLCDTTRAVSQPIPDV